jgi:DNA repair protein RecO (recombination protein O)
MPFNLFQPMMVVELVAYFKDGPNVMSRLKEVRAGEVYSEIPFDIRKGAVALFMAEVCRKSIQEMEENRDMFDFLLHYLKYLDTTAHPIANLHLHFLLHLTAYLGFEPQVEGDGADLYFDLKEGVYALERPVHGMYLAPEPTSVMIRLMQMPLEACHEVEIARADRKLLLHQLLRFYQFHLPAFSEVHTPDILDMIM